MRRTTIIAIMMVVGALGGMAGLVFLDGEKGGVTVPLVGLVLFLGGIGLLAAGQPSKKNP